ncbi:type II toxin-antitoxin system VapC family toxin [Arthrobacter sp. I2-34]|uniref:Ribonuclease VapC n=1 Tax=Arthrobacter hankyongi TaxID=2904801 RepID=A0ABS9LBT9_9MICC|nr:type II toxin-antitoxin system VapC family toxin [Arthrobacter hankyongi]MCG2624147.1 type II toxin-antitoxin system VapC family toxin [Arthrobacter hankyongi]
MTADRALLDTSVFAALESGRRLDASPLPEEMYVSVIALGELHTGVLAAKDTDTRARRLQTREFLARFQTLPVTAEAARHWTRLRYRLAEAGRRINVNDLWIASTALARDLPVATRDRDYDVLEGLGGPDVLHL